LSDSTNRHKEGVAKAHNIMKMQAALQDSNKVDSSGRKAVLGMPMQSGSSGKLNASHSMYTIILCYCHLFR